MKKLIIFACLVMLALVGLFFTVIPPEAYACDQCVPALVTSNGTLVAQPHDTYTEQTGHETAASNMHLLLQEWVGSQKIHDKGASISERVKISAETVPCHDQYLRTPGRSSSNRFIRQ